MEIREATKAELEEIIKIEQECFPIAEAAKITQCTTMRSLGLSIEVFQILHMGEVSGMIWYWYLNKAKGVTYQICYSLCFIQIILKMIISE